MALRESPLSASTGYLLFCVIITFALSIYLDASLIGFGVIITLLFVLSASADKGSTDKNLKALGWTTDNFGSALLMGTIGGVVTIILGSFLISYDQKTASLLVPDFSFTAQIASTMPIVSVGSATLFNILSQWFTIAPAEEALARVLSVKATLSFLNNTMLAYIMGSTLWILFHYQSYTMQDAPIVMYFVLGIMSIINILIIFLTNNVLSAVVSHAVFNTGVILIAISLMYFVALIALLLIISFASMTSKKGG